MKNSKGKPKKLNDCKNRRHAITLSEKAEYLLRSVCKELNAKDKEFNLSKFVSEQIVFSFELNDISFLKLELKSLEDRRDSIQDKMVEVFDMIRNRQNKQIEVIQDESY